MSKNCDILNIDDIRISMIDYGNYRDIPLLSAEEEERLFELYKSDDAEVRKSARDKIFYSNIRLVRTFAHKYACIGKLSYEDLFIEGCIGLVISIDRFNVSSENKFVSYAYWWIRQSIFNAIKKQNTYTLKVSFDFLNKVNVYNTAKAEYNNESFDLSFVEYLKKNTRLKDRDIPLIERYLIDVVSLDAPFNDDPSIDVPLCETIYDDINVEHIVERRILSNSFYSDIDEMMDDFNMSARDKEIIYYSFGLYGYPVKTQVELQSKYSISHQRVCQIVNKFLDRIKDSEECMNKIKVYSNR